MTTNTPTMEALKALALIISAVAAALILKVLAASYGQKSWARTLFSPAKLNTSPTLEHPNATNPPPPDPPPPIDLTIGDFGDISKVKRDHPILQNGRASDISPMMNDTRMTPQRIAHEFSMISERLTALEQRK